MSYHLELWLTTTKQYRFQIFSELFQLVFYAIAATVVSLQIILKYSTLFGDMLML